MLHLNPHISTTVLWLADLPANYLLSVRELPLNFFALSQPGPDSFLKVVSDVEHYTAGTAVCPLRTLFKLSSLKGIRFPAHPRRHRSIFC